jgi:competence ComEA-like helix-hairpin-helix protein
MTPMRKSHFIITTLVVLSLCASAFAADVPGAPVPSGVVNINTADATHLSYLPRIGAKAAQRIVDYRTQNGPFRKTTDLMQVKGFGEKRFEHLNAYLTVSGDTTLTGKVKSARKPRTRKPTTKPTTPAAK